MDNLFSIFIDRLKDGSSVVIKETFDSDLLEIQEEELKLAKEVSVSIEAYLADNHLVTHFSLETVAYIPCNICNEKVAIPIGIKNEYVTEPIATISSHRFDMLPLLRETILLHIPPFAECNAGHCPERAAMEPYLTKGGDNTEITYHPFADL